MRRQVLARDGYRCRTAGIASGSAATTSTSGVSGGRTEPANLMGACDGCHTLIHADLLEVRGTVNGKLRFLDAKGRPLDELTPAAREAVDRMKIDPGTRVPDPNPTDVGTRVPNPARGPGLDDLIGQRTAVRNLRQAVRAAAGRGEPLGHILLCGPPGLGKTSLARAVAAESGRGCRTVLARS